MASFCSRVRSDKSDRLRNQFLKSGGKTAYRHICFMKHHSLRSDAPMSKRKGTPRHIYTNSSDTGTYIFSQEQKPEQIRQFFIFSLPVPDFVQANLENNQENHLV